MLDVKYHACLRYVERVMGVKDVTKLSEVQLVQLRLKITAVLEPYLSTIQTLKSGSFIVDGISYDIVNENVVTVTIPNSKDKDEYGKEDLAYKRVIGGITKSGKKIKKIKHVSFYDRKGEQNGKTDR